MKSMKRIMGLLAVAGMLMFPVKAIAADGQLGIYVTPKVIYGLTYMKDVKYHEVGYYTDDIGNKWDSTFGGSLAAGYDFSKKLRIPARGELEYAVFSKAEAKGRYYAEEEDKIKQLSNIQTLFANVYYDINTGTKFIPYVGAGMGAGFIRTKGSAPNWKPDGWGNTGSKMVTNFAWNIGLGLGYQITNNVALDMGYRFADLGKVKTNVCYTAPFPWQMETKRIYQHQFSMGARFTF